LGGNESAAGFHAQHDRSFSLRPGFLIGCRTGQCGPEQHQVGTSDVDQHFVTLDDRCIGDQLADPPRIELIERWEDKLPLLFFEDRDEFLHRRHRRIPIAFGFASGCLRLMTGRSTVGW
jgi:hypothetical protein